VSVVGSPGNSRPLVDDASTTADTERADDDGMASVASTATTDTLDANGLALVIPSLTRRWAAPTGAIFSAPTSSSCGASRATAGWANRLADALNALLGGIETAPLPGEGRS
jgi:hypothetical protein